MENADRLHRAQIRYQYFIIAFISLLLFLGSYTAYLLIRQRDRRIRDEMLQVEYVRSDLQRMKAEHSNMNRVVTKILEERIALLQNLSERYQALQASRIRKEHQMERKMKMSEVRNLYRKELGMLRKDGTLTDSLEDGIDCNKGGLMRKVRAHYGPGHGRGMKMDDTDFRFLTLLFSGFGATAIGYLMDLPAQNVRTAKSRYIQRFRQLDHPDGAVLADALEHSGPRPGRPSRDKTFFE